MGNQHEHELLHDHLALFGLLTAHFDACMFLDLQVNASPSLTSTTPADRLLKARVIHDTLRLATPPEWDPHSPLDPATSTQSLRHQHQPEWDGHAAGPRNTSSPVMSRASSLRSQSSGRASRLAQLVLGL